MNIPVVAKSMVKSAVFEDNQACLSIVDSPKISPRNKELALQYHFFRSEIGPDKGVEVKWVPTDTQIADIANKALDPKQFEVLRKKLMGW